MDEFEIINRYFRPLGKVRNCDDLGIGDDAALFSVPEDDQLIVTTDSHVEGIHFPHAADPRLVGGRTYASSVSDIAAMGGSARWASLALTLPEADEQWLSDFSSGVSRVLKSSATDLIGGDMTRGPLTITWHIMGTSPRGTALKRGGACLGDGIYVSGCLGSAAAAIACDLIGEIGPSEHEKNLHDRYWHPQPQLTLGQHLRRVATSCIDISDGLSADLAHITRASKCGAQIEISRIPLSPSLTQLVGRKRAHQFALQGGDDYELCFTVPREKAATVAKLARECNATITRIGEIINGTAVRVVDEDGDLLDLPAAGYRHFE